MLHYSKHWNRLLDRLASVLYGGCCLDASVGGSPPLLPVLLDAVALDLAAAPPECQPQVHRVTLRPGPASPPLSHPATKPASPRWRVLPALVRLCGAERFLTTHPTVCGRLADGAGERGRSAG